MNIINIIRNSILSDGLEIINKVVKPVSEKWTDGKIHEADNLQLTLKSTCDSTLTDVMAYLYYYDSKGNELGHDFDITEDDIRLGAEAMISFILEIPTNCSYAEIEIKAVSEAEEKKRETKFNYIVLFAIIILLIAILYFKK